MSRTLRATAGGLTAVVATAAFVAGPSPAVGDPDQPSGQAGRSAPGGGQKKVTLITGDVVTLTDNGSGSPGVSVERGPGSTGGIRIQTVGDDLRVVPDQALPYLASGRLDADLFNVTGLVEQGYDDASVKRIPLIVQYRAGLRAAQSTPKHATRGPVLQSINGAGISASKADADEFWDELTATRTRAASAGKFAQGITQVHLDEKVEASLAESVEQVGAPEAWADGLDGTGVRVTVLDTGIDETHPDFEGQLVETRSFVPGEDVVDVNGHGTHVASTIAGTGAASGGKEKGVAPGADLAIGKVLSNGGTGAASWIIDGMEWGASTSDVVSMSLGSTEPSDGTDPMALAVNELSESTGTLFVIAAGNYGRVSGIGSPGAAQSALTVGAVDGNDERAAFQDMGPRLGDAVVKPEIVAPGVDILAARAAQSSGTGDYKSMSGTSMATPHVAGAAAILVQQHPDWTGAQLKDALVSTAKPLDGQTAYQVGAGRLDVPSAAFGDVVATASRELGFYDWPHDGDEPTSRTITYTNLGDADVTLDLSTRVTDDALEAAPDGLVTLSADQVTVPANDTAEVTVTATPDLGAAGSTYSGTVIASNGDEQVAQTAVGLVKEEERYSLDIKALDRDGDPTGGFVTFYRYGDQYVFTLPIDEATGTVDTQRLRPGTYNVTSWLPVDDGTGVALVGDPHLVVGEDTDLVLDASEAERISLDTPKDGVDTVRRPGYKHDSGIGGDFAGFTNMYEVTPAVDTLYAVPTGKVGGADYQFEVRWRRIAPLFTMTSSTQTRIDPLYQAGSMRWDGRDKLRTVFAGTGTAAEYDGLDVRGKAVLVRRSEAVAPFERAQAANDAGAAVLVVVNDQPGRLFESAGGTDTPVFGLGRAEGEALIAALDDGPETLTIDGIEQPPYLYDLVWSRDGAIPAKLAWKPRRKDLAKLTQRYVGHRGQLAIDARSDCTDWHWPPCLSYYEPVRLGTSRVDFVSTQEGTEWYQTIDDARGWSQRGLRRAYDAGSTGSQSWFDPVARPRVGEGYWHPRRNGDFFMVNVPTASSGSTGVTGGMSDDSTVHSKLFQDGTLVREQASQAIQEVVPQTSGWADYRFETITTRPRAWITATETRTTWDFRARTDAPGGFAYLPLLQLDYELATDLRGEVKAGKRTIGLRATHLDDVEGAGKVDKGTLKVSFDDGRTWQSVTLKGSAGSGWTAQVKIPKKASFVSLKAGASDDEGNAVAQEVIRAIAVR